VGKQSLSRSPVPESFARQTLDPFVEEISNVSKKIERGARSGPGDVRHARG
jgi:hypothetical protein